jgi:hypothetical protein
MYIYIHTNVGVKAAKGCVCHVLNGGSIERYAGQGMGGPVSGSGSGSGYQQQQVKKITYLNINLCFHVYINHKSDNMYEIQIYIDFMFL